MLATAILAAVLRFGVSGQEAALHALAKAVDLPTTEERQAEAQRLAQTGLSVEAWQTLMREFGSFEEAPKGKTRYSEELVLASGASEQTEIFVYVPESYSEDRPTPLIVALHGTGGSGENVLRMWSATAEELGFLVLAPSEAGENVGWGFRDRERASVEASLRWMRRRFNVDESRIHLTGVSRGGHATWDIGMRRPDRFASLSPMIGGPQRAGNDGNLRYLENIARVPIRDLQGAGDSPGLIRSLEHAFELLERFGAEDAKFIQQPNLGHSFRFDEVDWSSFLKARKEPWSENLVRMSAREDEVQNAWIRIDELGASVEERFALRPPAGRWKRLDEEGKLRFVYKEFLTRTARLEVQREGPGRFRTKVDGVKRFRIFLRQEDLPRKSRKKARIRVRVGTRSQVLEAEPDARVLLETFVERFDRTFLPVAEVLVRVPK